MRSRILAFFVSILVPIAAAADDATLREVIEHARAELAPFLEADTPQELETYTKKFGPTYAADVSLMIVRRDGRKALIVVNERWKESVFELEKTAKGWTMKMVGGWIS